MAIADKIANTKRSIEPCMFCKGRIRKREPFVPYRIGKFKKQVHIESFRKTIIFLKNK